MEPLLRTERLFDGLAPDEQRRLYFLLLVADKLDPREALAFAERVEGFVTGKTVATEFNPPRPFAGPNDPPAENPCADGTHAGRGE
jgi:hypothetical protein